jgi:hypothetical protein
MNNMDSGLDKLPTNRLSSGLLARIMSPGHDVCTLQTADTAGSCVGMVVFGKEQTWRKAPEKET